MTMTMGRGAALTTRRLLSKVPEVTIFFWIIKIMSTTVGETAANFLSDHIGLGFGTTGTSAIFVVVSLALVAYLTASKADMSAAVTIEVEA